MTRKLVKQTTTTKINNSTQSLQFQLETILEESSVALLSPACFFTLPRCLDFHNKCVIKFKLFYKKRCKTKSLYLTLISISLIIFCLNILIGNNVTCEYLRFKFGRQPWHMHEILIRLVNISNVFLKKKKCIAQWIKQI